MDPDAHRLKYLPKRNWGTIFLLWDALCLWVFRTHGCKHMNIITSQVELKEEIANEYNAFWGSFANLK